MSKASNAIKQGLIEAITHASAQPMNAALQANDTGAFLLALGGAVCAHGGDAIAQECAWSLAELEAILKPDSDPSFSDVQRICRALGVRLTVQPL